MNQMNKINLCFNETIKVKLTIKAFEFLKQEHEEFWDSQIDKVKDSDFHVKTLEKFRDRYENPHIDDEGFSSFMLWDFMNKFGKLFQLGFNTKDYFLDTYLES